MDGVLCTIDGSFNFRLPNATKPGEDPCNQLYWYPRAIPEYCYTKKEILPKADMFQHPIPMPIPVPLPPPMPLPGPVPLPQLFPPFLPAIYPLPFGIPLAPTNPMLPIAGFPYPPVPEYITKPTPPLIPPPLLQSPFASYIPPYGIQRRGLSMVPGLPGLVSPSGGINILPFQDAYADLLEKHKQKMIRKRLQKLLDEYDRYPYNGSHESSRRGNARRMKNNNIVEEYEARTPKDNNLEDVGERSGETRKIEDIFQKYNFLKETSTFD